jgi:signal transduction histidine kinase
MTNGIYQKTISSLSEFLDNNFTSSEELERCIFAFLKNIIGFDNAYIFFTNPDSIQLKYVSEDKHILEKNETFIFERSLSDLLFSKSIDLLSKKHELISVLGLFSFNSFCLSKLAIRNTVYGFILLCDNSINKYQNEHLEILKAASSVISYKIKDAELSDIFKLQLKALKDGILESTALYKEVQTLNTKLVAADKVKNEFLANITHELRTPLNSIIGFSDALKSKIFGQLNDKQNEYINEINISGINLLGMINEILDISKIEAGAMKVNKMEYLFSRSVSESLNMIKPLADKKNIKIVTCIEDENRPIYADYQKVNQILYNLMSNAIKFTPNGGKIILSSKFIRNSFQFCVTDSGCGIAKENQEKIFEKFVQLENSYTKSESSTGLGLTIVKDFVTLHGGKISLKSALNKGCEFCICLPLQ